MARILKNKTEEDVDVVYGTTTVVVEASSQRDLSLTFENWQLAASTSLIELIGQGVDKYQLNDGINDLSVSDAIDLVRGFQQRFEASPDGRLTTRQTVARGTNARYQLRVLSFYTANPGTLKNIKGEDWSDYGDVTCKCYDADGDELTDDFSTAVKTVIDFEPHQSFEIIGGSVDIPTSLKDGTTDAWWAWCIALPDIPKQYGGNFEYVQPSNLEAVTTLELDSDGRATSYMPYTEVGGVSQHTNKLRFCLRHPAGEHKRFQIYLEIFPS
jgi:hypothetical protein